MAESSAPDRQRKRRERTRGLLTKAATELVLERGVDSLTVNAIVEHADVARGTFYVYFPSKEAILWSLLEKLLEDIDVYLDSHPIANDSDRFAKWIHIFEHIAANRRIIEALIGEQGHIGTLKQFESYIAELMERDLTAGHLAPKGDIPLRLVARYLSGAFVAVVLNWLEQGNPDSVETLAGNFFSLARRQFESD